MSYQARIFAAVIAVLVLAVCGHAQSESARPLAGIESVYLARDDGKGKAGEEVTDFLTTDVPIWCVVMLDNSGKVTVKMNFVAVKVAGIRPETKVVSTSYTTSERQNRVNFNGRPEGNWPPGRYRVDLFVDGRPAQNIEFDIKTRSSDGAAGTRFVHKEESARGAAKHPIKP